MRAPALYTNCCLGQFYAGCVNRAGHGPRRVHNLAAAMLVQSLPCIREHPAILPEKFTSVASAALGLCRACSAVAAHPPAVLQEASKHSGDELPDFYNIVLERPRDDPKGYDVLFIDAAQKLSSGALLSAQVAGLCFAPA